MKYDPHPREKLHFYNKPPGLVISMTIDPGSLSLTWVRARVFRTPFHTDDTFGWLRSES